MIARYAVLALLPVVAVAALTRRRRLAVIIAMGLFSVLLAVAYLLLHAPDVALTEAIIGAALTTAIYVLAIRRTGRLTIAADEAPGLLAREGGRIVGLEHEILERFARDLGRDLSVQLVSYNEVVDLVAAGDADIGAGGLVLGGDADVLATRSHLETALFTIGARDGDAEPAGVHYNGYFAQLDIPRPPTEAASTTLDLARFLSVRPSDPSVVRHSTPRGYSFVVSRRREDLHVKLEAFLEQLRESGELDRLVGRYLT